MGFAGRKRYVWWQNLNKIREGVGLVDEGWLRDNICQEVSDGSSTLFWEAGGKAWLDGSFFIDRFGRLYELAEKNGGSS